MLLLIDNFDSFTYNIVHVFEVLGVRVKVVRNNKISVDECYALNPSYIVIGPGPGAPTQTGICNPLIAQNTPNIPILGICMGHQCLATVFGANVIRAKEPMHGKTSKITHNNQGIFKDVPQLFEATRYHSLIVERSSLPTSLHITAESESGEIMGLQHNELPISGLQFHPESLLTTEGPKLLSNFLNPRGQP